MRLTSFGCCEKNNLPTTNSGDGFFSSPGRGAYITFVGGVLVVSEAALGARPHLVHIEDAGLTVHAQDRPRLGGGR